MYKYVCVCVCVLVCVCLFRDIFLFLWPMNELTFLEYTCTYHMAIFFSKSFSRRISFSTFGLQSLHRYLGW